MKPAFQKSPIPETKAFIIKHLNEPFFDPNWHFHPEYQLFVVLEGKGTRFIGDSIRPFKEGDMVFTGPDVPHVWRSDASYFDKSHSLQTQGVVIYFHENFLGDSVLKKEEMEKIFGLFSRAVTGLDIRGETNRQITRMMLELLHLQGVSSLIQLLQILELLADSPDCFPIANTGYINQYKQTETARMSKVYDYVMKNFKHKISLDEVATLASMTPTSFSRYFKTRANKPFSRFVSEVRVGNACKLLHEDNLNIAQICYECGFNTLSNFNKQFKEIMRRNPHTYKEEYLKGVNNDK